MQILLKDSLNIYITSMRTLISNKKLCFEPSQLITLHNNIKNEAIAQVGHFNSMIN